MLWRTAGRHDLMPPALAKRRIIRFVPVIHRTQTVNHPVGRQRYTRFFHSDTYTNYLANGDNVLILACE